MGSFKDYINRNNTTATNKTSSSSSFMEYHNKRQKEREEEEEKRRAERERQKKINEAKTTTNVLPKANSNFSNLEDLQKEYDKLSLAEQAEMAKQINSKTSLEKLALSSNKVNNTPLINLDETKLKSEKDLKIDNLKTDAKAIGSNLLNSAKVGGTQLLKSMAMNVDKTQNMYIDAGNKMNEMIIKEMEKEGKDTSHLKQVYREKYDSKPFYQEKIDKLNQKMAENTEKTTNPTSKKIAEISQGLGNNIVGAVATAVNPTAGLIYFTGSAKGSYYDEAIQRGMSEEEAENYSGVMALMEGVTERYLAGENIKGFKNILKGQGFKNAVKSFGIEVGENFVQEAVMPSISEVTALATAGKEHLNYDFTTAEGWENLLSDSWSDGIDGALSSIMLNGSTKGVASATRVINKMRNGQTVTQQEIATAVEDSQKAGVDVEGILQEEIKNVAEKKVSQEATMANQNNQTLQNNIDTNIENTQKQGMTQEQQLPVATGENTYSNQLKQTASEEINNSNIPKSEKNMMLDVLNGMDTITDADLTAIRDTIEAIKETQQLDSKGQYKNDQARRQKYVKYKNDTNTYDDSAVNEVLDMMPKNRNGRRTVKQWLQTADEIGKRIANLSNEEIERIAYKSWFDIQPSKSITQYDNIAKKQVGFQKFTSDEWINAINNAVNEARANNQTQENLTQAIEVKDNINSKIQEYLDKTGLSSKMSVDEFINRAEKFTLENEENMTAEQQELYDIIKDIQNRNSLKEEIVDYDNGIWYNDEGIDYSNKFYEKQLDSAITTDTPNLEKNKLHTKEFGDNFYIFEKTDDGKYTKYLQLKIEGNEDIINFVEEAVKNGELTNIQKIHASIDEYWDRDTNSNGFNSSNEEQTRENGQSGRLYREESKFDIRPDSKGSNENSNVEESLKVQESENNSGSFNLPKVKEGYTRLYRGLENDYNANYDKRKLDNSNGYESWTDSYELAKAYGDNVYYIDVPTSEIKNSIIDEDSTSETYGDRNLIYANDKPVGIKGKSGSEYMIYTDHDNYSNLKYNKVENNDSAKDNKGRRLTKEVQEFFEDVSPEVKDENGNIKTLYHGSNSKFTIFDLSKSGQASKESKIGFWFTESEEGARKFANEVWYGDNEPTTYEVYLNLKNPKVYENRDSSQDKMSLFKETEKIKAEMRNIKEKYEYADTTLQDVIRLNNYANAYGMTLEKFMEAKDVKKEEIPGLVKAFNQYTDLQKKLRETENILDNTGYDDSYEQFKTDLYSMVGQSARDANLGGIGMSLNDYSAMEKLRNHLIEQGYDGIVIKNTRYDASSFGGNNNQYVAFYPEQIKSVKNQNPTNNPDILKEEYIQLSIEGFNREPENNLAKNNWVKYQETKKKTNEVLKREGTKVEVVKRKFSKDFVDNGYIDLNGKTINDATDVADMAQIFRNPKYETFRVIYTKGNMIVGQEAVSSKTPNETKVYSEKSMARGLYKINNRMERLEADGYYLIHNHPTGTAKASNPDIKATSILDDKVPGFLGHIIINSGTYALIERASNGDYVIENEININNYKADKVDEMLSKEAWANTQIKGRDDILNLAYDLKNNPNYSSLILTDAKMKPRIILDVPNKFLNMSPKQINGYVRNVARQNGASSAFLATQDIDAFNKVNILNTFQDCILYTIDDNGDLIAKKSKTEDDRSNSIFARYNSITLRANEKIEDIYNSIFETNKKRSTYNSAPTAKNNVLSTGKYTKQQNKTEEQKQIAKIIDEPITKQNEKSRIWAIAKANIIDKGIVFEELSRKANNRELQGKWDYTLSSEARGQNAIGKARYERNSKTKTEKQISKSLEDIREDVGNKTHDFQQYMYHQLNIDRMTLEERFSGDTGINYERKNAIKNKPVFGESVTADISRKIVAEYEQKNPEFKKWAKDVYDFLDANKKELVDRGVISQELSDKLAEMYPHYVPIKRVDAKGMAIKLPLDTNRTGVNVPLAKATGGSSDIQPLFQTIADRTMQTYRASARNNFGVELMNTLNSITETSNADIDTIIEEIGDADTELLKEGKNGNNPTFTVFKNGEKITFEITKDMYDALKPQSEWIKNLNNSKLSKGLNKVSNFRRGVLTEYNPVFFITNPIKDIQDVVINSQHPAKTYAKIPEAYAQIMQKGYWYNEYIQNGGEQNSYFKDGEFTSDKKVSKLKKAVTIPLETISKINNVMEMAPRLAEYIASREAGTSVETSMLDASRVTTNFKAGGDVTKTLNRNGVTFLNASVQGMQQQIRNIQEANAKGLKGYAVLATKYAIAGLPVALLNGLIWKDDDDYEELQDYAKDNYYIIAKYGDGKFIRIPKGRVSATIQKIVGNAMEYVTDDKKLNIDNLGKDFWEDLKFTQDNLAPNNPLDNNILSPIIQAITNTSWYGEDIVPSRLKDKPAEEQYDESIDSLSIAIGSKLGISPYKINYLLDQYGGGISDVVLPMMTKQAENNMFTDKFTTDSVMKNKHPGEFYESLDSLKEKANSVKATDEDILKYKYLSSVSSSMNDLYKEKREIQNSNATDKTKKEKLRIVQEKINKIAKEAVENNSKIRISGNTATINDTQFYKAPNISEGTMKWSKVSDKEKEKNKNISLKTYADYKNKIANETIKQRGNGSISDEGQLKDKDKIKVLLNSNYSSKEKEEIYQNYVLSSNDKKYPIIKESFTGNGLNIQKYLEYKNQEFSADTEDDGTVDGKTVSGSKKTKVWNYIENMNISYTQKLLLYGLEYTPSDSQQKQILNYVKSMPNKTNKEKLEILSQFKGFTIYKDGTVEY